VTRDSREHPGHRDYAEKTDCLDCKDRKVNVDAKACPETVETEAIRVVLVYQVGKVLEDPRESRDYRELRGFLAGRETADSRALRDRKVSRE